MDGGVSEKVERKSIQLAVAENKSRTRKAQEIAKRQGSLLDLARQRGPESYHPDGAEILVGQNQTSRQE